MWSWNRRNIASSSGISPSFAGLHRDVHYLPSVDRLKPCLLAGLQECPNLFQAHSVLQTHLPSRRLLH